MVNSGWRQAEAKSGRSAGRKLAMHAIFLGLLAACVLGFHLLFIVGPGRQNHAAPAVINQNGSSVSFYYKKNYNYRLTHPLLMIDQNSESKSFATLKTELSGTIEEWKRDGRISSASVYLSTLNDDEWMGLCSSSSYLPGSLMKVPVLIYYLKQEQEKPGFLKTVIRYVPPRSKFPAQNYPGDSIRAGHSYAIHELLRYMIAESDNNATYILTSGIEQSDYASMFSELGIPVYDMSNLRYSLSPAEYSRFFKVLYNATYLNEELSEYALKLLTQCNFKSGMLQGLPSSTVVAHKFGERGIDVDFDFSESAIIYGSSGPYLLTIMTRGRDVKKQTELVTELSRTVYKSFSSI